MVEAADYFVDNPVKSAVFHTSTNQNAARRVLTGLFELCHKYGKASEPTLLSFMAVKLHGGHYPYMSFTALFLNIMRLFNNGPDETRKWWDKWAATVQRGQLSRVEKILPQVHAHADAQVGAFTNVKGGC